MGLAELWSTSRKELEDKHIRQVIAIAGGGKLLDGSDASKEFREFLSSVPSGYLSKYALQCFEEKFEDSGIVLQDIVNQVGKRLGFDISYGRYRGSTKEIGFDGLWNTPNEGGAIVIEVKTSVDFKIDLNTLANYRRALIKEQKIDADNSSILIVVGRDLDNTENLEEQIRGSKYAWDVRLISVDSLLRLMNLKEKLEDPQTLNKIPTILLPQEYTKVDGIIDLVFSTTSDVREEEEIEDEIEVEIEREAEGRSKKPKFIPVKFHDACSEKIQLHLKKTLIKQSRVTYTTPDESLTIICAVSKEHKRSAAPLFWFAFHQHQKDALSNANNAMIAFGCGSEETILLIPFADFSAWLDGFNITKEKDRLYWHVQIFNENEKYILRRKKGHDSVDLTKYLVPRD
jgi:hypothetical protein